MSLKRCCMIISLGILPTAMAAQASANPCTGSALFATDDPALATALSSESGLAGVAHGLGEGRNAAVMTVMAQGDFFGGRQLNLIPNNVQIKEQLSSIGRNDKICVRGELTRYSPEQAHVVVNELTVLESWHMPYAELPPYEYKSPSIEDLPDSGVLDAQVHAIGEGMLILEAGDRVIPLVIRNPAFIPADLYRFDRIQVAYGKKVRHGGVSHLLLDETLSPAIEVIESLRTAHGTETSVTGHLVLFPKSPLITRDIFGIGTTSDGQTINYTVVNFSNMEVFEAVQKKLQDLWKAHESDVVRGRNYFLIPDLQVTARGRLNVQSPSQANPQIIVEDVASVE